MRGFAAALLLLTFGALAQNPAPPNPSGAGTILPNGAILGRGAARLEAGSFLEWKSVGAPGLTDPDSYLPTWILANGTLDLVNTTYSANVGNGAIFTVENTGNFDILTGNDTLLGTSWQVQPGDGTGNLNGIAAIGGPSGKHFFTSQLIKNSAHTSTQVNQNEVVFYTPCDTTSRYCTGEVEKAAINPVGGTDVPIFSLGHEEVFTAGGTLSASAAFPNAGSYGVFILDKVTGGTVVAYGYGSQWKSANIWNIEVPVYQKSDFLLQKGAITQGAQPTITGCATISSQTGGEFAGTFVTSGTSCTPVLTFADTSGAGFACVLQDMTHPLASVLMNTGADSTNSATFPNFTTTASDRIRFQCGWGY